MVKLASRVVLNNELNFAGHGDLSTLGATHQSCVELVDLNRQVLRYRRKDIYVTAGGGNLERFHALGALFDVNQLSGLDTERGAVNELTINEDVTVHDHLTRLRRGASETSAKYESVKTHLKELNKVLTRQARLLACLLEDIAKLCFTDAVLGTKALLLTQTNCVVRVGLTLRATVLTRSIGTLFEVLCRFRRQGNAQRT
jgi:hypothetical protein